MSCNIGKTCSAVKIEKFFNLLNDIKTNTWKGHTVSNQVPTDQPTNKLFKLLEKILKGSPDPELIRVRLKGLEEPQNNENFNKLLQNLQSRIEEPASERNISDQKKQKNSSEQSGDDVLENQDSALKENSPDLSGQKPPSKQKGERKGSEKNTEKTSQTIVPITVPKPVRKVRKLKHLSTIQETPSQSKSLLIGGIIGLVTGIVATSIFSSLFSSNYSVLPSTLPSTHSDLFGISIPLDPSRQFTPQNPENSFGAINLFGTPDNLSYLNKLLGTKDDYISTKDEHNQKLETITREQKATIAQHSATISQHSATISEYLKNANGFNDPKIQQILKNLLSVPNLTANDSKLALLLAHYMAVDSESNGLSLSLAEAAALKGLKSFNPIDQKQALNIYFSLRSRNDYQSTTTLSQFISNLQFFASDNLNVLEALINKTTIPNRELRDFLLNHVVNSDYSVQEHGIIMRQIQNLIQQGDLESVWVIVQKITAHDLSYGTIDHLKNISFDIAAKYPHLTSSASRNQAEKVIELTAGHFCKNLRNDIAFKILKEFYTNIQIFDEQKKTEFQNFIESIKHDSLTNYDDYHSLIKTISAKVSHDFITKMNSIILHNLPINKKNNMNQAFEILGNFMMGMNGITADQINTIHNHVQQSIAYSNGEQINKSGYSIINQFLLKKTWFDLTKDMPGFDAQEKSKHQIAECAKNIALKSIQRWVEVRKIATASDSDLLEFSRQMIEAIIIENKNNLHKSSPKFCKKQAEELKFYLQKVVQINDLNVEELIALVEIAKSLDPSFNLHISEQILTRISMYDSVESNTKFIKHLFQTKNVEALKKMLPHMGQIKPDTLTRDALDVFENAQSLFRDAQALFRISIPSGKELVQEHDITPTQEGYLTPIWNFADILINHGCKLANYAWSQMPSAKKVIVGKVVNTQEHALIKNKMALNSLDRLINDFPDQSQDVEFTTLVKELIDLHIKKTDTFPDAMDLLITTMDKCISLDENRDEGFKTYANQYMPINLDDATSFLETFNNEFRGYKGLIKLHNLLLRGQRDPGADILINVIETALRNKMSFNLESLDTILMSRQIYKNLRNIKLESYLNKHDKMFMTLIVNSPDCSPIKKLETLKKHVSFLTNESRESNQEAIKSSHKEILNQLSKDKLINPKDKLKILINNFNEDDSQKFVNENIDRVIGVFADMREHVNTDQDLVEINALKALVGSASLKDRDWIKDAKITTLLTTKEVLFVKPQK